MAFYSVAGQRWFIGPAKDFQQTDFIASNFTSISAGDWDEIKGIISVGQWGDESQFGSVEFLDTRRRFSFPTTYGAAPATFQLARDPEDDGQAAILAAAANPAATFAMRCFFNDAPGGGTPTTAYFIARWSPPRFDGGTVQDVDSWTPTMTISSNVVIVPRAA